MFKVLNDLIILPTYVEDALTNNYLGLALAKNVNALRDILSPRDLSFYVLVNEPGYLFGLLRAKINQYNGTSNVTKIDKGLTLLDSIEASFPQKGMRVTDPEILQGVETLRLELLGASLDDVLGYLGSIKMGDVPFISVKYCGIDVEQMGICPYFVSDESAIQEDLETINKTLISLSPVEDIAQLAVFKAWEVGIHKKDD